MIGTFSPRSGEEQGAILIIASTILVALIAAVALVVDIGHQSMTKRQLHTVADIAAQDALYALAANFIPANCGAAATIHDCAQQLAASSAARNGFPVGGDNSIVATIGTWDLTASPPQFRLVDYGASDDAPSDALGDVDADTESAATAIRVVATTVYHNQIIAGSTPLSATAIAEIGGAGVEVGTYAASVTTDAVVGPLIGTATGGVTLAGYQGLAATSVTLGQLAAAGGFASPDDLLNANVTQKDVITWTAKVLDPGGTSGATVATALRQLKADATTSAAAWASTTFQFRKLFASAGSGVGIGHGAVVESNTAVNALKLVTAAPELALINGTNTVSMTLPVTASIPGLVPGSATSTLTTSIIQGPQIGYGPIGTSASTAQIRAIYELKGTILVGDTSVDFDLPIVLQGFGGLGTIRNVLCASDEVDIDATPTAATAAIGDTTGFNFFSPVPSRMPATNLLSILGAPVLSGSTDVSVGQPPAKTWAFVASDPWSGSPLARGPKTTSSLSAGKALQVNLTGAQRVVNDAQLLLGSTLITSASANFTSGDVGSSLSGLGIPSGTTIVSVQSSSTATMSTSATSAQSNDAVTIGPASGGGNLALLGGTLPLGTLLNSVLNPVLGTVDTLLQPIGAALGVNFAGLDTYNPVYPGTSPASVPAGINCSSGQLLQ